MVQIFIFIVLASGFAAAVFYFGLLSLRFLLPIDVFFALDQYFGN